MKVSKPNSQQKIQQHRPIVKIYYLKNNSNLQNNIVNNPAYLNQNSLYFISSFIQKQKGNISLQNTIQQLNSLNVPGLPRQHQPGQVNFVRSKNNNSFMQNRVNDNTSNLMNRNIHTSRNNYQKRLISDLQQIQKGNFQPHKNEYKRLIKTSQQYYSSQKSKNHSEQNIQKDFLCNLVKDWNEYPERKQKKNVIHTRRRSIQPSRRKYNEDQIQQMSKNKTMLNQHFNLFLQNQKSKSKRQIQDFHYDKLKAIFHKQQSDSQIDQKKKKNKGLQLNLQKYNNSRRKSLPENYQRQKQIRSKANTARQNTRKQNKKHKIDYFRLLQGPQVKMIPKMYENEYKIRNFNWTKLDKRVYKKVKQEVSEIQWPDKIF